MSIREESCKPHSIWLVERFDIVDKLVFQRALNTFHFSFGRLKCIRRWTVHINVFVYEQHFSGRLCFRFCLILTRSYVESCSKNIANNYFYRLSIWYIFPYQTLVSLNSPGFGATVVVVVVLADAVRFFSCVRLLVYSFLFVYNQNGNGQAVLIARTIFSIISPSLSITL